MPALPETNILMAPATIPVFWFSLHEHVHELAQARIGLDEVRASHPASTPSNVKAVYMSPWKSHHLNDKFHPLCALVEDLVKKVSAEKLKADFSSLNWDLKVTDCWGVIYEDSDRTVPHMHFPSDLSVVIYLEADENCAPIVLGDGLLVTPKPGLMIMFPGILMHEVPENHAKRVVLAMNLQKMPALR